MKNVKKVLVGLTCVAAVIAPVSAGVGPAVAAPSVVYTFKSDMPIKLLYNARQLPSEVQPEITDGTTLVPLRVVSDKLGGKLTLIGKRINVIKGDSSLELTIGSSFANINGKTTALSVPVKAVKGRTLVPLRVVSEGLGVAVEYDPDLRFVWIGSKDVPKLEDVVKPVDIKPYMHYFKYDVDRVKASKDVLIVKETDFPFIIENEIQYRWDLASDTKGNQYIKASTTDKGVMSRLFYFVGKDSLVRLRRDDPGYRQTINQIRIHYYRVADGNDYYGYGVNDKHYDQFKISNVDYIGIYRDQPMLVENFLK